MDEQGGENVTDINMAVEENNSIGLTVVSAGSSSSPVTSVDGKTGAVQVLPVGGSQGQVLKKASATNYDVEWADESGGGSGAVSSVNGQTGVVVLTASDVSAGTYSKPSGGIPATDLASAVQTSLGLADTALQSAPVASVNGQTGAVTLTIPSTAADVGALPAETTVSALVECLNHVAWADGNGAQYIASLRSALLGIVSISATYTQSGTVYDTDSLDSLKSDLVVTATYEGGTTETVTSYTLSGTLSAGTSTVTVSYGGLTDTISVIVTMSRTTRFGTFHDGYSISKSAGGTVPKNGCFVSVTAARAAIFTPVSNLDDTITVTDSSKYNLTMLGLTSNTAIPTTLAESYFKEYYTGDTRANAWRTSDHLSPSSAPYILIALKKMDGTAFTEAELADGAAAVFSYTPA